MLKEKIIELRATGMGFRQIARELKCARSTVSYHLGEGQIEKAKLRVKKNREKTSCFHTKLYRYYNKKFKNKRIIDRVMKIEKVLYEKLKRFNGRKAKDMIKIEDALQKFGDNPVCYLTGVPIDLTKSSTYQLDHIIPGSRGGDNSINNLGLLSSIANQCKRDLTDKEFIELCRKVVLYQDSKN